MVRKLKYLLAVALGFSAACSSVRNAPKTAAGETSTTNQDTPEVAPDTLAERPRVVVMYGVRPPEALVKQIRDSLARAQGSANGETPANAGPAGGDAPENE